MLTLKRGRVRSFVVKPGYELDTGASFAKERFYSREHVVAIRAWRWGVDRITVCPDNKITGTGRTLMQNKPGLPCPHSGAVENPVIGCESLVRVETRLLHQAFSVVRLHDAPGAWGA